KFRPRRHWQEETAGQKILEDFSEADTGFTLQYAGLRIEGEKPVKPCVADDAALAVQGRIAVTTPQPERYEGWLGAGLQDGGQLAPAFGPVDTTTFDRETTPAGEWLSYKTFCHSAYSGAFGRNRRRGFHCRLPIADCRLPIADCRLKRQRGNFLRFQPVSPSGINRKSPIPSKGR